MTATSTVRFHFSSVINWKFQFDNVIHQLNEKLNTFKRYHRFEFDDTHEKNWLVYHKMYRFDCFLLRPARIHKIELDELLQLLSPTKIHIFGTSNDSGRCSYGYCFSPDLHQLRYFYKLCKVLYRYHIDNKTNQKEYVKSVNKLYAKFEKVINNDYYSRRNISLCGTVVAYRLRQECKTFRLGIREDSFFCCIM